MDPANLTMIAIAFAGSCIAQKCADASLETAWARVTAAFKAWRGSEATSESIQKVANSKLVESDVLREAEAIFGLSTGLQRARLVEQVLKGARILWVDDHPENNAWERSLLRAFEVEITTVETTRSALASLARERFDVVLSDIAREDAADEGIRALPAIKSAAGAAVIFYVGRISQGAPPTGAFGITNNPNELLHLLLDTLERSRMQSAS